VPISRRGDVELRLARSPSASGPSVAADAAEGGHGLDGAVAVLRPAVRYQGHVLIENRSGLIVANCVSRLHHGGMNEFGNRC
jgi:hypothetical protein